MTNRARTYPEYLKSSHWKALRARTLKRDAFTCRMCSATDCELHVHHSLYRGWYEERDEDLITLCRRCHLAFHAPTRFLEARWWAKPLRFIEMIWRITR